MRRNRFYPETLCNTATSLPTATSFVTFSKVTVVSIDGYIIIDDRHDDFGVTYVDPFAFYSREGDVKIYRKIFFFFFKVFVMEMKSENGDLADGIF